MDSQSSIVVALHVSESLCRMLDGGVGVEVNDVRRVQDPE